MKTDPRFDVYISKASPFAQPILKHIRKLIHSTCPDVVETIKWSFPHFEYKGNLCSMAAFKEHMAFGFHKAAIMKDYETKFSKNNEEAMGYFGRITSMKDLPSDKVFVGYIKEAMKLNDDGVKVPRYVSKRPRKEYSMPDFFKQALQKNKKAKTVYEAFSTSNQREYLEWLMEAKTDATREKRLATTLEWLSEGKPRNWKYMKR